MFKKIHNNLTLLYSVLITFFLLSFTVITYFLVSSVIYLEQKQEVNELIILEVQEHKYELKQWYDGATNWQTYIDYEPDRNTFYYVVGHNGEIIYGDEMIPNLHIKVMDSVKDWVPNPEKVRFEKLKTDNQESFYVAMTGQEVYESGELLGIIYAGINITAQRAVLERLIFVLVIVSFLFIILSTLLAYYMAGKAMIPITRSFQRQREFVADASHELRTPLSILQAAIEVIEYQEGKKLTDFSKAIIQDIKDELKRMANLIRDLLTLARSDSGVLDLAMEKFNLAPLINQLVRSLTPLITNKKLQFYKNIPENINTFADKNRITQLIYILLDNAIKYTPEYGEISLSINPRKDKLEIIVQDSGVGISPDQEERIFDRFYRGDKERSRDEGGSGLGLAIARWIVNSHQGSIHVHSKQGKGSTFTVFLPQRSENLDKGEV